MIKIAINGGGLICPKGSTTFSKTLLMMSCLILHHNAFLHSNDHPLLNPLFSNICSYSSILDNCAFRRKLYEVKFPKSHC